MACYSPLHGYQSKTATANGKHQITFTHKTGFADKVMTVPCGICIGCRIDRSRSWAIRCVHESKMHQANSFLTLTYNDENLPEGGTLVKEHLQGFIKRLRSTVGTLRYFACGEYGEKEKRPHYHVILFGHDFAHDRKYHKKSETGNTLYTSETLSKAWTCGHAYIGAFTYATAAYTARYVLKKVNGEAALEHYQSTNIYTGEVRPIKPEFIVMSLKPGIGKPWYDKYKNDAFPSDFLVHEGKKHNVPKYYTELLKRESEQIHKEVKLKRKREMKKQAANSTPDRLYVREQVKKSKLSQLKRGL